MPGKNTDGTGKIHRGQRHAERQSGGAGDTVRFGDVIETGDNPRVR